MNKKDRRAFRVETLIIIIIAICMVFLINFTHEKLNDFARLEQEALLVNHDPSNPIHDKLAKEIMQYRPDAYKMIEIYKPDFSILMTLQFIPGANYETNLKDHPELIELFYNNEEGHTQIKIGDKEEDVYFRWTSGENNDKYLIVIYASRRPVRNMWMFTFVCYMVLLLIFALLIRLRMTHYNDKISQYKSISDDLKSRLR